MGISQKILGSIYCLFFVITVLLFNSCSIGGAYFFANESDHDITLIQHFKDIHKYVFYHNKSYKHTILQEIKDPELTIYGITNSNRKFTKRTHKYLKPVPIKIDSTNQIVEIIIPSKRAIRFDTHRNFNYNFSKKIQFKINHQIFELDDLNLKYKSRGFGNITQVIKYQG